MTDLVLVGPRDDPLRKVQWMIGSREPGWSVIHCVDADSALQQLQRRPAAIVIGNFSEIKDYESFFAKVSESSPGTIRLALCDTPRFKISGAHQILAARCDSADLHPRIVAAAEVASRTARHEDLKYIVSRFHDVPSPPLLYFDIREQLNSESGTTVGMAEIASRDPALVARVLRIANSGFYGRPRSVVDLSEAIVMLGTDMVLGLVLAAQVFSGLPPPGVRLDALWAHASEVAALARRICHIEGGDRDDTGHSFVAGLLHDIGLIVLLQNEPARYQPMWKRCGGDESALIGVEQETFGITHGELGAVILKLWNLPVALVDAVATSHGRPETDDTAASEMSLISRSVMAAEWLLDGTNPQGTDEPPSVLAESPDSARQRWFQARNRLAWMT